MYSSLQSEYFPVFFDKERLDIGEEWKPQLEKEVSNSNHLVVLWSSSSLQSQWVFEEIKTFKSKPKHGLIIFICLDIDNKVNSEFQSIKDIKETSSYEPNQINTIDKNCFEGIINNIRKSVYKKNGSRPIKRAVFTLTKSKFDSLGTIANETRLLLKSTYEDRFAYWKPIPCTNVLCTRCLIRNTGNITTTQKQ